MANFLQGFDFEFLILGHQNFLKGKEVITQEYLLEDLAIPLAFDSLYDAFFKCFLGNADLFNHGFEQESRQSREFLKDLGVLKLIFLCVFEDDAVFFDKIEEGIAPDGRGEVLPHVIIDPLLVLAQLVLLLLLLCLLLLLLLGTEQPLQHKISYKNPMKSRVSNMGN